MRLSIKEVLVHETINRLVTKVHVETTFKLIVPSLNIFPFTPKLNKLLFADTTFGFKKFDRD